MRWPIIMMMLVACDGAFETTHGGVDEGNDKLAANDPAGALAAYNEAASSVGGPGLDYDRGLSLSASGNQSDAIAQLLVALRPSDDTADKRDEDAAARAKDLQQRVNAALGLAHAKAALALEQAAPATPEPDPKDPQADGEKDKKPDEAVMAEWKLAAGFLEDALRQKPDDVETRRTLEVALLRIDPPCVARDDKYEENDVAGTAKLLEPKAPEAEQPQESSANPTPAPAQPSGTPDELKLQEQLFSCPDDDDWYQLDLHAGDRLSITLTVPPKAGKLELSLEKPSGEVVATGLAAERTIGADEAGKWLLVVRNIELDEVSYGLEVKVRPPCSATEDRFEDNDVAAQAKLLTPGGLDDLKLCPNDEDWYAVDLAEGESLFLYAQAAKDPNAKPAPKPEAVPGQPAPPPPPPPFQLEIRDATGTVRNTGGPSGDALVATLLTPGAGRYEMRVFPRDPTWEGRYSLMVQIVPPCPEGDDRFEDNDVVQDATDFMKAAQPEAPVGADGQPQPQPQQQQQGPPVVFARVCPGDIDWWTVTDDGTKPAVWTATFDHGQGDLALTLYDETGLTEIASSNTSSAQQNGEAVPLPVAPKPEKPAPDPKNPQPAPDPADEPKPEPKKYTLKVAGVGDGQNFYLLRLDRPQGGGGGDGDSNDQDQDQQDQDQAQDEQDKDEKQDQKKEQRPEDQEQDVQQERLDKEDRNPENLEAKESAKRSPRAAQRPIKDW